LAAFMLCVSAAIPGSIDRSMSIFGNIPLSFWSLGGMCSCLAAFGTGRLLSEEERGWERLEAALAACSIPVCAYAVLQSSGIEPFLWAPRVFAGGRPASTLGNPAFLGLYLATIFPLALSMAAREPLARSPRARLGGAALLSLTCALVVSGSRAAVIGASCGAGLLCLWPLRKSARLGRIAFLFGMSLLGILLVMMMRRETLILSDGARLDLWKIALRQFWEAPGFGGGPDSFTLSYLRLRTAAFAGNVHYMQDQAHNDLLQIAATLGAAGLLAYAWLHVAAGKRLWRELRREDGALSAVASLFSAWVFLKFSIPSDSSLWPACLVAGMLFGESVGQESRRRGILRAACWLAALSLALGLSLRAGLAARSYHQGEIARAEGRLKDAAAHLEEALERAPDSLFYRGALASVLFDAADAADAEGRGMILRRASQSAWEGVSRHPRHPEAYSLLAQTELQRVRCAEESRRWAARQALEVVAALNPFDPRVPEALAELARLPRSRKRIL
jgi:O-antigen ligase